VALFVLGFVGWLIQGAGDDETVPTLPAALHARAPFAVLSGVIHARPPLPS
jgi:hypothetical protein